MAASYAPSSASWWLCAALIVIAIPVVADAKSDPSVLHGTGQVIAGLAFELPKTVLDSTLSGPPVVGTLMGVLAGTVRALQVTVEGLKEISDGFDPWGIKRDHAQIGVP